MILCLDLSLSSTGYATFHDDFTLVNYGKIVPEAVMLTKDTEYARLAWIISYLEDAMGICDTLVYEDVYHGLRFSAEKWMLRLSGAVINEWQRVGSDKEPVCYMASEARKLVGLKGNSQKAEIQIWVLDKVKKYNTRKYKIKVEDLFLQKAQCFNLFKSELKDKYKSLRALNTAARKKANSKYKYQMNKLSKLIEKETGFGEDLCDAILLGYAHQKALEGKE